MKFEEEELGEEYEERARKELREKKEVVRDDINNIKSILRDDKELKLKMDEEIMMIMFLSN
jgi:uncharacterized membrane protein